MRFLIVVKSRYLREYLETLINIHKDSCFSVDNASEVIDAYGEYKPDFVILDIDLRNNMCFRLAENLKQEFPDSKLLFVSDSDDIRLRRRSNKIGDGIFILKENIYDLYSFIRRT